MAAVPEAVLPMNTGFHDCFLPERMPHSLEYLGTLKELMVSQFHCSYFDKNGCVVH